MKIIIHVLCLAVLLGSTWALCQEIDKAAEADAEVSRFIDHWTRNLPPKWRKMAYEHKPYVVQYSLDFNLDPILVSRIVSRESSWRQWVIGKRGEIGLMQINNDKMKRKYDVAKADQNIKAGCDLLRQCIDSCPTLKAAVGKYGSGHCTEKGAWLESRWKQYQKDIVRFRTTQTRRTK